MSKLLEKFSHIGTLADGTNINVVNSPGTMYAPVFMGQVSKSKLCLDGVLRLFHTEAACKAWIIDNVIVPIDMIIDGYEANLNLSLLEIENRSKPFHKRLWIKLKEKYTEEGRLSAHRRKFLFERYNKYTRAEINILKSIRDSVEVSTIRV